MNISFAIPIPPSTTAAPVVALVVLTVLLTLSCPVSAMLTLPTTSNFLVAFDSLTSLLNVTGPSNCDKICLDVPPSTNNLSLTITSSATILNLFGSSPVMVGIGTVSYTHLTLPTT